MRRGIPSSSCMVWLAISGIPAFEISEYADIRRQTECRVVWKVTCNRLFDRWRWSSCWYLRTCRGFAWQGSCKYGRAPYWRIMFWTEEYQMNLETKDDIYCLTSIKGRQCKATASTPNFHVPRTKTLHNEGKKLTLKPLLTIIPTFLDCNILVPGERPVDREKLSTFKRQKSILFCLIKASEEKEEPHELLAWKGDL